MEGATAVVERSGGLLEVKAAAPIVDDDDDVLFPLVKVVENGADCSGLLEGAAEFAIDEDDNDENLFAVISSSSSDDI
jgi:hypothetical protein